MVSLGCSDFVSGIGGSLEASTLMFWGFISTMFSIWSREFSSARFWLIVVHCCMRFYRAILNRVGMHCQWFSWSSEQFGVLTVVGDEVITGTTGCMVEPNFAASDYGQ